MTEGNKNPLKSRLGKHFTHSNIIRASIIAGLTVFYVIFLSPLVENKIINWIGNIARNNSETTVNTLSPVFDIHVYAGSYNLTSQLGNSSKGTSTKFLTVDSRILAMNKFLSDYHSPLAPYAQDLITYADQYGLDWRLVASISGVESAFGNLIPSNSHNGWGWRGINANSDGWSMFLTWTDGIKEVTRGLAQGYGTTLTPFQIEPAYCPPCASNDAHNWANGVTSYMDELDYYMDNLNNL